MQTGGGASRTVRTPTLFVGNNPLQLQQIGIPGVAALEQGALVAITLKPVGTLAMLWLMLRGAFGQLGQADNVFSFGFKQLTVQPAAPMRKRRVKVATDGEVFWLNAPLVFDTWPDPLLLLKPRRDSVGTDGDREGNSEGDRDGNTDGDTDSNTDANTHSGSPPP